MAINLPSFPSLPSTAAISSGLKTFSTSPTAVLNAVSLIASNLPGLNPPYAIYAILNTDTFIPLTVPDSWGEFAHRTEAQVSDYPIEDGAFASYNKVRRPAQIDATLVKTGSDLARASWLEAIRQQQVSNPLAQYHIITPQGIYQNMTITRLMHQTRSDRGSNMLYLELQFSEILKIEMSSLAGDNAVDSESGPMRSVGRVFTTSTSSANTSIATTGAPAGSALAEAGN